MAWQALVKEMKLVVGLGNPGSQYEGTRHNVGFEVLNELGRRWQADKPRRKFDAEIAEIRCGGENVWLAWPQTFMNLSGRSVGQIVKFHQLDFSHLLVISDDLNLKVGQLRMRGKGSAGGQKGLLDIIRVLGTEEIPRLRIGIDRPAAGQETATYVLSRYTKREREVINEAIDKAVAGVEAWVAGGLETAMNLVNGFVSPESKAGE